MSQSKMMPFNSNLHKKYGNVYTKKYIFDNVKNITNVDIIELFGFSDLNPINAIKDTINKIFSAAENLFNLMTKIGNGLLPQIFDSVMGIFKNVEQIPSMLSSVINKIETIPSYLDKIPTVIRMIAENIQNFNVPLNIITNTIQELPNILNEVFTMLTTLTSFVLDTIKNTDQIPKNITKIMAFINNLATNISKATDFFNILIEKASNVGTIFEKIFESIGGVGDLIQDAAKLIPKIMKPIDHLIYVIDNIKTLKIWFTIDKIITGYIELTAAKHQFILHNSITLFFKLFNESMSKFSGDVLTIIKYPVTHINEFVVFAYNKSMTMINKYIATDHIKSNIAKFKKYVY